MKKKQIKRNVVLGVLFFLPVTFLLFLYPAKHNYNTLDVIGEKVIEATGFSSMEQDNIKLEENLTVLSFLGTNPKEKLIAASNLKELIYDKFKGFKKFQVVVVLHDSAKNDIETLKQEIGKYEALKYWHYITGNEDTIRRLYASLNLIEPLDENLASNNVVIIDKELNLRGRIDDRTDGEKEKNVEIYPLKSYNCIEVAEIKNKMSEDLRILFTEYRQKRKGNFDSSSRRSNDLKE